MEEIELDVLIVIWSESFSGLHKEVLVDGQGDIVGWLDQE